MVADNNTTSTLWQATRAGQGSPWTLSPTPLSVASIDPLDLVDLGGSRVAILCGRSSAVAWLGDRTTGVLSTPTPTPGASSLYRDADGNAVAIGGNTIYVLPADGSPPSSIPAPTNGTPLASAGRASRGVESPGLAEPLAVAGHRGVFTGVALDAATTATPSLVFPFLDDTGKPRVGADLAGTLSIRRLDADRVMLTDYASNGVFTLTRADPAPHRSPVMARGSGPELEDVVDMVVGEDGFLYVLQAGVLRTTLLKVDVHSGNRSLLYEPPPDVLTLPFLEWIPGSGPGLLQRTPLPGSTLPWLETSAVRIDMMTGAPEVVATTRHAPPTHFTVDPRDGSFLAWTPRSPVHPLMRSEGATFVDVASTFLGSSTSVSASGVSRWTTEIPVAGGLPVTRVALAYYPPSPTYYGFLTVEQAGGVVLNRSTDFSFLEMVETSGTTTLDPVRIFEYGVRLGNDPVDPTGTWRATFESGSVSRLPNSVSLFRDPLLHPSALRCNAQGKVWKLEILPPRLVQLNLQTLEPDVTISLGTDGGELTPADASQLANLRVSADGAHAFLVKANPISVYALDLESGAVAHLASGRPGAIDRLLPDDEDVGARPSLAIGPDVTLPPREGGWMLR